MSIEKKIKDAYRVAVHAQERNALLSPSTISIFYGFLRESRSEELTPETRQQARLLDAMLLEHAREHRYKTFSAYIN